MCSRDDVINIKMKELLETYEAQKEWIEQLKNEPVNEETAPKVREDIAKAQKQLELTALDISMVRMIEFHKDYQFPPLAILKNEKEKD